MFNIFRKKEKYTPNADEELRLLYPAILNDIQFIKKQQVEITNYVVGGLVAIGTFFNLVIAKVESRFILRFIISNFLGLVSLVIAVFGIWYICRLEKDLGASRDRKRNIKNYFTETSRSLLEEKGTKSTVGFYYAAIVLGEILVLFFLQVR